MATIYTRQLPCGMEIEVNEKRQVILFGKGQQYFCLEDVHKAVGVLYLCQFVQEETRKDSETERGLLFVAIAEFLSDHEKDIVG